MSAAEPTGTGSQDVKEAERDIDAVREAIGDLYGCGDIRFANEAGTARREGNKALDRIAVLVAQAAGAKFAKEQWRYEDLARQLAEKRVSEMEAAIRCFLDEFDNGDEFINGPGKAVEPLRDALAEGREGQ